MLRAAVALLAALALALGLAAPATASGGSRHAAAAEPSPSVRGPIGPGSISGHVTFPDPDDAYDRNTVFVRNHRVQRRVRVNFNGDYTARDLPSGTYHVIFNRVSGYASNAAQFYSGHDEYQGTQSADDVVVSGGPITHIDASLHTGGSIQGVLRDTDGHDLSHCLVQAYTSDDSLVTRDALTDTNGAFTVGGLTTGAYLVRVVSQTYHHTVHCDGGTQFVVTAAGGRLGTVANASAVPVVQGQMKVLTDPLVYARGGAIKGHVVLPSQSMDSDRYVVARGPGGAHRTRIDPSGDYALNHLAAGSYRVTFDRVSGLAYAAPLFFRDAVEDPSAAGGVPSTIERVSVSAAATSAVSAVSLVRGGSITGKVVNDQGVGLDNCYVQAYRTDGRLVTRAGYSSANGSFTVGGLSAAAYQLRVLPRRTGGCNRGRQFYVGAGLHLSHQPQAATVTVTLGNATPVGSLAYTQGGDISGHINFPSGHHPYLDRAVTIRDGHFAKTVYADRSGDYTARGLLPGSYRVTFNRVSGYAEAAAQFYNGHDESEMVTSAQRVTVVAGQSIPVNGTLHTGGTITGRLVDQSGQPVHCGVQAFTTDGSLVTRDAYSYHSDGSFAVGGLTSGAYYLRVVSVGYPRSTCDAGIEYLGASSALVQPGPGTPVSVQQGQAQDVGTLVYARLLGAVTNVAAPSISGATVVGSLLTAGTGSWTPTPTSFAYQWSADGVAVPGATGSTYASTASDVGKAITVQVRAGLAQYRTGSATSAPVGPVTSTVVRPPLLPVTPINPTFTLTHQPKVAGTARVGHVLKAHKATVTPVPAKVTYQWLRNGKKIKHAKHPRYKVTKADRGKKISLRVTYIRPGYPDLVVRTKAVRVR